MDEGICQPYPPPANDDAFEPRYPHFTKQWAGIARGHRFEYRLLLPTRII